MSYFITTSDARRAARRAARWQRLFGTNRLPVLSAASRWDVVDGRDQLCYDLDLARLHWGQRDRMASYVARCLRRPYDTVRAEIEAAISWPVSAAGCVVETDEATESRPSPFFMPAMFAREHWRGLALAI